MLELWYSSSRQIKFMMCVGACIVIYFASLKAQLDTTYVVISLAIGMLVHGLRSISMKISPQNPYKEGFGRLSGFIPLIGMITLFGYLPEHQQVYYAVQCVGFSVIGFALVSIYSHRAKRIED